MLQTKLHLRIAAEEFGAVATMAPRPGGSRSRFEQECNELRTAIEHELGQMHTDLVTQAACWELQQHLRSLNR